MKVERVEQSGRNGVTSTFVSEPKGLDPEWTSGTAKLERRSGTVTVTTVNQLSSFNRSATVDPSFGASFDDAVARYLRETARRNYSKATRLAVRRTLRSFRLFLLLEAQPTPDTLLDVTPHHLIAFRDHELTRERKRKGGGPLSPRSVALAVFALKSFFAYLLDEGLFLYDVSRELAPPRLPKPLPRGVPTLRQMRRLLTSPDVSARRPGPLVLRDRAIVEVLYATGIRNSELCGLKVSDVDFEAHTLHVRHGKGGKQRIVPLGRSAQEAIERYLEVSRAASPPSRSRTSLARQPDTLFLSRFQTPLNPVVMGALFRRFRQRAGLPTHLTPHALRHACATHLLKGGADIRQIQVLLGHASLKSTEIYTRVETGDLKKMLERCHPRERLGDDSQRL